MDNLCANGLKMGRPSLSLRRGVTTSVTEARRVDLHPKRCPSNCATGARHAFLVAAPIGHCLALSAAT